MSRRDEVLRLLTEHPEGLTDGELSRRTGAQHSGISQLCRQLAAERAINRDQTVRPIRNHGNGELPVRSTAAGPAPAHHQKWFWEGNIQGRVVRHLAALGATVRSVADTATKARGTDIVATLDGRTVHVEVKGWPSTRYADPDRAAEQKRTQPTVQAKHWFAEVVLGALRLRGNNATDRVVIACPEFPRYQRLAAEIAGSLASVGIEIWFVTESGEVHTHVG